MATKKETVKKTVTKAAPFCIPATLDALEKELINRKTDTATAQHRLQRLRDEVNANSILSK